MSNFYVDLLADDGEEVICDSQSVVWPKVLAKKEVVDEDCEKPTTRSVDTKSADLFNRTPSRGAGTSMISSHYSKLVVDSNNGTDVKLDVESVRKPTISSDAVETSRPAESSTLSSPDPEAEADSDQPSLPALSRRARRRLAKRQKKLEMRPQIRKEEKERRKKRRRKQRENGQLPPRAETHKMCGSKCNIRIAVDMAYEELMSEDLIRKTLSQLAFCYASNRKLENPLQYYITNLRGRTKTMFESRSGNTKWDIHLMQEPLTELWAPSEIVYLTADSENVLEWLDDAKVYVIGGLIDHNAHKGVCLKRAVAQGFSHARLPIDDYVMMKTRKVLTINHVFDILVHFSVSKNWEEAFFSAIPVRKGVERLVKMKVSSNEVPMKKENSEQSNSAVNAKDCSSTVGCAPTSKRPKLEENWLE